MLLRQTRLALILLGALSVSAVTFSPVVAQAQGAKPDKSLEEAKERFKRGMELYKEGSLDGAVAELQRAYQLAPNWKLQYNIGVIFRDKRNYVESIRAYERFLAEGGKNVDAAKRKEVEKDLEQMRKFVAKLEITTNVEGAELKIDDEAVGMTPLGGPIPVNAGKHRVTATISGRNDAVETITIAGGDELKVTLNLAEPVKAAPPPPAEPPKPPPPPPPPGPPLVPIVLLATGGAALVTGTVFGILTLSARSDAEAGCKDGPSGHLCGSDAQSALDREKTFGLVTDISLIAGVALVGVGTYLLLTSDRGEKAHASQPTRKGMTVVGRARVGGIELAGTF